MLLFAIPFFLLVMVFPEIDNLADGRLSLGSDLNEIQPLLLGNLERITRGQYSKILSAVVDDADFRRSDSLVDA